MEKFEFRASNFGFASYMKSQGIHKILFITLSNIGDVVLTLPVLSSIKHNFLGAEIDVVVGPRAKEIFAKDKSIRNIIIYDKKADIKEKALFVRKLQAEKYDLAVDMRSSLIPVLIGAKNRTALFERNKVRAVHKKSVHLNKIRPLGMSFKGCRNICIDDSDRERVRSFLRQKGLREDDILIGVSAACRSRLKEWSREGFIEVINNLLAKKYKVVLIGDAGDTGLSKDIKDAIKDEGFIDMTARTNLNELCALIGELQLLLTCDSACLHIASDLGVKVVALFGPTDPREYGPTGKHDIVINKRLECAPCNKAVCCFKQKCMDEITPLEVLSAIQTLLAG